MSDARIDDLSRRVKMSEPQEGVLRDGVPQTPRSGGGRRHLLGSLAAAGVAVVAGLGWGEPSAAPKRGRATVERQRRGAGHSHGKRGERGEAGPGGPAGSPGSQGEKGEKGDAGNQGDKGDKGDQGNQGLQGGQGDKGDKGDKGDPGLQTITLTDGNSISPNGIAETSTATCAEGATAIGGGWTAAIVSNCDVVRNARSEIDARNWEVTLVCFNGSATAFRAQAICLS